MPGLTYFAPKIFSNPLLLVAGSGFPKLKIGKIRLKAGEEDKIGKWKRNYSKILH